VGKPSLNAAQPYAKAEGRVFLLVPAYPGGPGTKAVKRLLLVVGNVKISENNRSFGLSDEDIDEISLPRPLLI